MRKIIKLILFYDSALTLNVYGKDVKNIVNTILR